MMGTVAWLTQNPKCGSGVSKTRGQNPFETCGEGSYGCVFEPLNEFVSLGQANLHFDIQHE